MLGRCRLRRGVSLEVIVEEDDNAEVVFDPLMEEDDDDDDDDDSENGTGGSAPSSPREDGDRRGGRGNGGGGDGEGSALEERRRKRERRRTIGGLSRFRSVSCEALTLLDTSDMDSCCSEWDDDDELATSNSSNYVTLNRPISRRRIIESSQSQCDSEDSGIEYHSNEDDHVLEDHSSNEDHVEEEEVEEEEEDEEADREVEQEEDVEEITSSIEGPTEEEEEEDEDQQEDQDDDEEETATITLESDNEGEDSQSIVSQDVDDALLSARTGKELFEERTKHSSEVEEAQETAGTFNYSPNEALENDKIIIVETTPSTKKPSQTIKSGLEVAEEEMRLKREAYTIRNKEVRLAELPKPDTVKSVKQLFENLNTPVQHFHAWRDLGRFREIKSNPSSKILRFDRSDGNDVSPLSHPTFLSSSSTLPRLPSQGGILLLTSNKNTITQRVSKTTKSTVTETSKKTPTDSPRSYKETPLAKILKQSQSVALKRAQGECISARSADEESSPQPVQLVKTQSGQKVALRKPIVKGFNVKKALMENPRNFLPHDHASNQTHHHQQPQQRQSSHHSNRQRQAHISKSQHHSETADRSDTESLASDISDDSGVSNDSILSTSSSTPSTYRVFDAYASDPSFKWIDPEVMAKIRAVGTTVIFFGPRPRPKQEGGGTLPRGSKSVSSGLQATPAARIAQRVSWAGQQTNEGSLKATRQKDQKVPGPRIVGVVRKQSPIPSSNNASPTGSAQNTPTPTPLPTDTHSDDSRSSSPGSRSEEENGHKKAGRWRSESDTVVYNFTRPQPPAVYF